MIDLSFRSSVATEADVAANQFITFRRRNVYTPCKIGAAGINDRYGRAGSWSVPSVALTSILAGRHVALLKIDIDHNEGELLHAVIGQLEKKQARIDTILVAHSGGHFGRTPGVAV